MMVGTLGDIRRYAQLRVIVMTKEAVHAQRCGSACANLKRGRHSYFFVHLLEVFLCSCVLHELAQNSASCFLYCEVVFSILFSLLCVRHRHYRPQISGIGAYRCAMSHMIMYASLHEILV